ncbi:MAG: diacylglycerol/lipid kinase family protein [Burkholderiales bacterium]
MRVTLIHHPGAGDDDQPDAEALQKLLQRHGHKVNYQSADDELWAAALDAPADLVAVAGGDGTVGRVAKKLIGRDIAIAPVPLGTANNISRTLGLTELTLDEIVAQWHSGRRINFDVGVANGPWGTRYFVEAIGVGLFACTISEAEENSTLQKLTDADAKIAYAVGMLRERLVRCEPHALTIRLDGKSMSGEYVLFEAMNMEFVGPNLYLAPDMRPDDGQLDVVLVTTSERDELQDSLANWQVGALHKPNLTRYRSSEIQLEWSGFEVHLDDEAWPTSPNEAPPAPTQIQINVERNALQFLAPGFSASA